MVVSRSAVLNSWTTRLVLLSATSRALVCLINFIISARLRVKLFPKSLLGTLLSKEKGEREMKLTDYLVRENDILCLLESEREARRLR